MRVWIFSTIILLALASAFASAFVSGMKEQITVGESPALFSFSVENDSGSRLPLSVELEFPTKTQIVRMPEWVEANGSALVVAKIFPQNGFEDENYIGRVRISLGTNKAEKNIFINYVKENKCSVVASVKEAKSGFAEVSLQNNSYRAKEVELLEVRGVPGDWSFTGGKKFTIGAFESRKIEFGIERQSSFDGIAEFVFSCNGELISGKMPIKHDGKGVISTGMALIGGISRIADAEFVLNAFLVIIASILLIAFIARMVRILNQRNGKNGE